MVDNSKIEQIIERITKDRFELGKSKEAISSAISCLSEVENYLKKRGAKL